MAIKYKVVTQSHAGNTGGGLYKYYTRITDRSLRTFHAKAGRCFDFTAFRST